MKSHNWADFSVVVESEFLWRVIFDNPPINLVTPEMLVELPELIDAMQAATELRVVSIAKIRGRVRGIGNELSLAMDMDMDIDMRFASRQALFGQPETASGNLPGWRRSGIPPPADRPSSSVGSRPVQRRLPGRCGELYLNSFLWPGSQRRRGAALANGRNQAGDYEMRLGHYLGRPIGPEA